MANGHYVYNHKCLCEPVRTYFELFLVFRQNVIAFDNDSALIAFVLHQHLTSAKRQTNS